MAAADAAGLPLAAEAHGAEAVRACVAVGVHAVEHCTFMTADGVDHDPALLRDVADSGIIVRTTPGSVPGGPPPAAAISARMGQIMQGLRSLRESGARLVVSTDAGVGPGTPHDAMAYAVRQFGRATEDPLGAMRARSHVGGGGRPGAGRRSAAGSPRLRAADLLVVRGEAASDPGALMEVEAVHLEGQKVVGPSLAPPTARLTLAQSALVRSLVIADPVKVQDSEHHRASPRKSISPQPRSWLTSACGIDCMRAEVASFRRWERTGTVERPRSLEPPGVRHIRVRPCGHANRARFGDSTTPSFRSPRL